MTLRSRDSINVEARFSDKSNVKRRRTQAAILLTSAFVLGLIGCATEEIRPNEPLPEPPGLTRVPHPSGNDIADARAIFYDKSSPVKEEMKGCDGTFLKLQERAGSKEDLSQGTIELVQSEPVYYHWCFYSKVLEVHDFVRNPKTYLDERREKVIKDYTFLSAIARSFLAEFNDSRYMRWSIEQYQALSLRVFYRRLELTETGEVDLLSRFYPKPYGRLEGSQDGEYRVLEKYGLLPKRGRNAGEQETPVSEEIIKLGNQGKRTSDVPAVAPIDAGGAVSVQVEPAEAPVPKVRNLKGEASIRESIGRLPAEAPPQLETKTAEKAELDEVGLDNLDRIEPVPVSEDEDGIDLNGLE
jgi:hypothetical protein